MSEDHGVMIAGPQPRTADRTLRGLADLIRVQQGLGADDVEWVTNCLRQVAERVGPVPLALDPAP